MEEREEVIEKVIKKKDFDVIVTTYEGVQKSFQVLSKFVYEYLIIDEAHKLKNDESKISIAMG